MANTNVKGITVVFEGDTTKLDKALRDIEKGAKAVDKELKQVNYALKFDPKNVTLLTQKSELLKQKVSDTEKSLEQLRDTQKQLDAQHVSENSEEYRKLEREIEIAEANLKRYKSEALKLANVKLTALGKQIEDTGKKFETAGKSLTKYVTVPLTAAGAASLKAGMDFDSAMSQVAATMGKTTEEIEELREFAIEMGSTTSFSATEAAEALNYMALAGYNAETSMKMLPTVLNLAAAGGMDLAKASDAVTDAQSALGLSVDDTTTLIDQLAKTSSTTNTSVEQLSEAILTVGGTARDIKGGTAELTQILGILADNGIKGSEGGTALRNMMLKMAKPTKDASAILADFSDTLGHDLFYDAEGNLRNFKDIMLDLQWLIEPMSTSDKNWVLSTLFNARDLKSVNALLNTTADRWDEVAGAIDDAGGAAEKMAKTQLDNLKGSLTILKSALEGAAIAVSDVIAPVIRKFAEMITKYVDKFNKLSPTTQKIIVAIGVALAALGPVLLVVGKGMQLVGKIMQNVTTIVGGLSKAITFLAANPIVLIIAAIAALVAAFVVLWNKSSAFRAFWIKLWWKIKDTVQTVAEIIKAIWNGVTTAFTNAVTKIKTAWSTIGSFFREKWAAIKAAFSGVVSWFGNLFANAWSAIKSKFSSWSSFWGGLWTAIKNKFSAIGTSIASAISGAVRSGINGAISRIESIINSGISLINGAISLINKIPGVNIGSLGRLNLPRLAKGGVLNGAQMVVAGEAGPEAIIPLDKLFAQMDKMAKTIAGTGGGVTVNVYGGAGQSATSIAEEVRRVLIEMEKRRTQAWA